MDDEDQAGKGSGLPVQRAGKPSRAPCRFQKHNLRERRLTVLFRRADLQFRQSRENFFAVLLGLDL